MEMQADLFNIRWVFNTNVG